MTSFNLPTLEDSNLFETTRTRKQPKLLIELPHGATTIAQYKAIAQHLPLISDNFIEFYFTNTDIGSPEIARTMYEELQSVGVCILRSLIPRTFIDCNRVLGLNQAQYREAKVTPGIPSYVPQQYHPWLRELHHRYVTQANELYKDICAAGGIALMLHSYAPKSVGISTVDKDIVKKLHWAYSEPQYSSWPFRPEIDLIATTQQNVTLSHPELLKKLTLSYQKSGFTVGQSQTYPMHPSTSAYKFAQHYLGQTVCVEFRRDLLVERFLPCQPMTINKNSIVRIAKPFIETLKQFFSN